MGIKTRFNPLGGVSAESQQGDLSEWRYSTGSDGKITLYEYLGQDTAITVPNNNTVINAYYNSSSVGNVPFYNNKNIVSVDLNNVPFVNKSMNSAFYNAMNLRSVEKINSNVTNMRNTFARCSNLVNAPVIPNSVTCMVGTFRGCNNLINAPVIPNSVTNMESTFESCKNLVNAPILSSNLRYMFRAFYSCNKLVNAPVLPNSVSNISGAFCSCSNLVNAPIIPNSVSSMWYSFSSCGNLTGNIFIHSAKISNATTVFDDSSAIKNVYIPYRYINNALTLTRNTFNTAGYIVGTGVGNATINNCVMYDFIAKDYPTYTGNGTHWILSKYGGSNTRVVVPREYTTYDTFPTAIQATCFTGNTTITDVDCNNIEFTSASSVNAFSGCTNLVSITNINLENVNNISNMFKSTAIREFPRLQNSSSVTDATYLFFACSYIGESPATTPFSLPQNITKLYATFCHCSNIMGFYDLYIGSKVTNMHSCFKNCAGIGKNDVGVTYDSNIKIFSAGVSNITNCFYNHRSTPGKKNLHMYFTYSNGKSTTTYTKFNGSATYRNNATSGFYMYDLSGKYGITENFVVTNNISETFSNENEMYLYRYIGHSDSITIPRVINTGLYPDINQEYNAIATPNMFGFWYEPKTFVKNIDFNNVPFLNNHFCISNSPLSPVSVNNISNTITNFYEGLWGRRNLSGNLYIHSSNITNAYNAFSDLYNTLNVYFPFKYENGEYTATYNSFINQTYNGITYKDIQEA